MKRLSTVILLFFSIASFSQSSPKSDTTQKKIITGSDIIRTQSDNREFERKGSLTINEKDVRKYIGRSVIVSIHVINTEIDKNKNVLLFSNDGHYQVVILIESKNRKDFDMPEFHYKNKNVRIVGRVTKYEGKSVIEIINEDQIQIKK